MFVTRISTDYMSQDSVQYPVAIGSESPEHPCSIRPLILLPKQIKGQSGGPDLVIIPDPTDHWLKSSRLGKSSDFIGQNWNNEAYQLPYYFSNNKVA